MCGYVRVCVRGFNSHAFIRKKAYDESSITSSTQFVAHQLSRVNYVKLSYICVVSIFIVHAFLCMTHLPEMIKCS